MKSSLILLLSLCASSCFYLGSFAQAPVTTRHLFIITIDGFRWQEVFKGADPSMIANTRYTRDTALARELYGDSTEEGRRRKLLPFFWNVIAAKGRLYGNRSFDNDVNVKNIYKISYPGYNEMFTGHTNLLTSPNLPVYNKNRNVLEYLDALPEFHGKVVVFTSWNVFPFILNEQRNGLPINSGYQQRSEKAEDTAAAIIDSVQDNVVPKTHTRYDLLTWVNAREYINRHHPSVAFIGLGETDEFAHSGRYDLYLQKAADIDRMIAELWYMVQTDPFYKDNTTILITTDHGRGSRPSTWFTHGFWARGSGAIWLAALGPDISPEGEMKEPGQLYQKQLAATIALLLGVASPTGHPDAKAISFAPPVLKETSPFAAAAR